MKRKIFGVPCFTSFRVFTLLKYRRLQVYRFSEIILGVIQSKYLRDHMLAYSGLCKVLNVINQRHNLLGVNLFVDIRCAKDR